MPRTYPPGFFDPPTIIAEIERLDVAAIPEPNVQRILNQIREATINRLVDIQHKNSRINRMDVGFGYIEINQLRLENLIQPHWEPVLCRWDMLCLRAFACDVGGETPATKYEEYLNRPGIQRLGNPAKK